MDRKAQLDKAFQRGHFLSLRNKVYRGWIKKFIVDETKGDIGFIGDITSNALFRKERTTGVIKAREKGIIAGIEEVSYFYKKSNIRVRQYKKDGDKVKEGDVILTVHGNLKDILRVERSGLDIMQRMSGIATLTYNLTKKIKNKVAIAPTRKTQWRYMDKKAVFVGGGLTHRLALWDAILIKDNHIKHLKNSGIDDPIKYAIAKALGANVGTFIEIEVTNRQDAITASQEFKKYSTQRPYLIMLDNMKPNTIKNTLSALKREGLYNHVLFEASGGIVPGNIASYANSGVDVISLGYLTNSVSVLDIKQDII